MKILLNVSYLGENYCGFQTQCNENTIQDELEKALESIFKQKIRIVASGRTDAKVSAISQVVDFEIEDNFEINIDNLYKRLNSILPADIRILDSKKVENSFHSRFNAKQKTYIYNFYLSEVNIPYFDKFALRVNKDMDINKMQIACKNLIGEYDFSAFCASGSSVVDKTRAIYSCEILPLYNSLYCLKICGNGFLYNMVRIIMGTIILIGENKSKLNMKEIILKKDRKNAGKTVSGVGLVLAGVSYV